MKLKFYLRNLLATIVLVLLAGNAWAQSRSVTGIVYDTDGKTPMVGATILVKNTTNGVISGIDGSYTIEVPGDDATLIFQSLGYDSQEITVGPRTRLDVTLKEAAQKIDEVVVTALGLTRSEKSVGYAISKVDGDILTQSTTTNWVSII